ncbi:MAG: terminase, partial [Pseudorhodobacter sp.]
MKSASPNQRDLFTCQNGPNTPRSTAGRTGGGTVPFSLLEKIRGKSPGIRAIQFLGLLSVPEGKKAGKALKLADFQRKFVKGTFSKNVMVGVLSIGRGNAKTALAAGLS